jgi:hypothetical protein
MKRRRPGAKLRQLLQHHRFSPAERAVADRLIAEAEARSAAPSAAPPEQPLLIPRDPAEGVAPRLNRSPQSKRRRQQRP